MSGGDRLSELPYVILEEILSHLDMKQVVQTCILSKQWNLWRDPWVCLPNQNFDRSMWITEEERTYKFKFLFKTVQFMDFVNEVLNLRFRSRYNTIHKFSLSNMDANDSRFLDQWITCAALLFAEELHLDNLYIFPKPVLGDFKTLRLTSVSLPCNVWDVWTKTILLSLEFVETLMIEDCVPVMLGFSIMRKLLIIEAPMLKHLVVKNKHAWFRDYEFVIDTPNLISILLKGHPYNNYFLRNMTSLESADVQVKTKHNKRGCLNNILRGISTTKCLTLSASTFQTSPKLLYHLKSFHRVKILKLTQWRTEGHIGAMAELLQFFPCVENLILEGTKETIHPKMRGRNWGAQLSFQCMLSHLKTVEIRYLEGCDNELRFLNFLMKNASILEKIIIKVTKFTSVSKEKELVEFIKKLQLQSMSYSSAVIILKVKTDEGPITAVPFSSDMHKPEQMD